MRVPPFATRYAAWIDRYRWVVLTAGLVIAGVSFLLALRLPLRSDMSALLPPNADSVVQLHALQKRIRAFGTVFIIVQSDDAEIRERATKALYQRLQALDSQLIAHVTYDDSAKLDYFWNNRFLFADLDALTEARDTLKEKIRRAKLLANPLFVDLDDGEDDSSGEPLEDQIGKLRQELDEAEAKLQRRNGYVSRDGKLQLLIVRSMEPSSDVAMSKRLVAEIEQAIRAVTAEFPPGSVVAEQTGDILYAIAEHEAIVDGMVLAAIITVVLCALALFWFYRAFLSVAMSLWSLTVGVLATFAVAQVTIGYLNVITAFLTAIVVGNGVNAGLILLSRYQEELGEERSRVETLAAAIAGAARGTFAASLAAGIAYGSLVVTEFRGFQHFGIIGGAGMVLCWMTAFTVLPAGLCVLHRFGRVHARHARGSALGRTLAAVFPRNPSWVVIVGAAVIVLSAVVSWHYVVTDPMENNWKRLRADGKRWAEVERRYQMVMHRFERDYREGVAGRFAVALDDAARVPEVVAMMRAVDKDKPPERQLLAQIVSIQDLLPSEQEAKLALLDEIRVLLADPGIDGLGQEDKKLLDRLRPPEDLRKLSFADIPEELSWPFIEQDGTVGRIILATSAPRFQTFIVEDRLEFAAGVRQLLFPDDALLGGQTFVVADIIAAMEEDGPKATIVALMGAILMVWLVVGRRRHGMITLFSGAAGVLGMVALLDVFEVKINFLDFVALPITIGIGIDYSVNIAVRDRQEGHKGPRYLLSTIGASVVLCSYTTIVGYGSLLLSENAGIRSFGLAAILGEFSCIAMAVLLTPALLAILRRRASSSS